MHIKKFAAASMADALRRIREELGPEALILESRRSDEESGVRGGVVVLAAAARAEASPPRAALATMATATMAKSSATAPLPAAPDLEARVDYLTRLVKSDHFSAIPLPLRSLYLDLVDADVDSSLVFHILQKMGQSPLRGQFVPSPPDEVLAFLRTLVRVGGAIGPDRTRRVIALVGPTGVGKTTTAAKIAGLAAFRLGRRVALISTDSYRIFGAQHLASYADLMGLPFESVRNATEMRAVLRGPLAQADLVLIDTSGRSPRDPDGIREVHDVLAVCPDAEVHLVLAANGRVRDLGLAVDAFAPLPVRYLVFTKLDEAVGCGSLYSTALKSRRPVAYLGTGQDVPDALVPATPHLLTRGLLTSPKEEASRGGSGR